MSRSRYRRRHPPAKRRPRKTPATTAEKLLTWGTIALVVLAVLWFVDARSGLLRPHHSPLPALLIDLGVVAAVTVALAVRAARRSGR